ncbi:MAG: glycosyltransferase family 2 protein [Polymorphobacter sp.]|uniref:glycosyltransferase family 2 protein n=1 Tax=Polymorphobacter sp. TaxID=1909290 RepID=UPI003A8AFF30
MSARLAVVLVNWNRWRDTIECLESLLASSIGLKIIVVDNASADQSTEHILAWSRGEDIANPASEAMSRFSTPPSPKPVSVQRLASADIPSNANAAAQVPKDEKSSGDRGQHEIILVESDQNLGFAGGNNLGIRLAMADRSVSYVWLLNNDTVVATETPANLLATLETTENVGQCGTVVRYYHAPDTVQALCGSRFQPITGRSWSLGAGTSVHDGFDPADIASKCDFVLGASLAVSRAFIDRVGLMEESYFLYFEEIDWAIRNQRHSGGPLTTAFAANAVVWHKEGGTIGSSSKKNARSLLSEYWLTRSRISFTVRYYKFYILFHIIITIFYISRHLLQGRAPAAANLTRALFRRPFSH